MPEEVPATRANTTESEAWEQPHKQYSVPNDSIVQDEDSRVRDELRRKLLQTQPGRLRRKVMTKFLVEQVSQVIGVPSCEIDETRPLAELGLSSQAILELGQRLRSLTGAKLSPTAGWQYPSILALSDHVAELLQIPLGSAPKGANRQ